MRVIIVDDEPKAIELIASYIRHFSDLELVQTFRNGLKALEFLNTNTIDIIFLDINMPHLNGLSLSKIVSPKTAIVFTTAYSEYAVESYSVNAVDYLLKPISLDRFSASVNKLINRSKEASSESKTPTHSNTVFIKSGQTTHQVKIDEIDYLKKDGNYMLYYINDRKIMVRQTIGEALQILSEDFLQAQKSYIINFNKVESITSESIRINDVEIPIGDQYKKQLQERIQNRG